ncbi:MAG: PKD domain-containing protein [Methanoregula sp.]
MRRTPASSQQESAVSEIIGSILLISVVVIGVAVVGIAFLSHPAPEKIPALSAVISEDTSQHILSIYHDGGDPLSAENTKILVDGVSRQFSKGGLTTWSTWSMGESLSYTYSGSAPGLVQIIYSDGSSSILLVSSDFGAKPGSTTTTVTTSTTTTTPITTTTTAPVIPVVANFSGTPTSNYLPLTVQFTDLSTGPVTGWNWSFGDGNTSTLENPSYTYANAGLYTVSLTVTNASSGATNTMTKSNYITVKSFVEYVTNESVFVYGSKLYFQGNQVIGPGSTIILTGTSLTTGDFNGGALVAVTNIYIDGDVALDGGSASWGSSTVPGGIYVNGDLTFMSGGRNIYGNVYVAGNFNAKDTKIHGNVYVNGDVTLGWTPTLDPDSRIYYTGVLTVPAYYDSGILAKCIHVSSVPGFTMPSLPIPPTKSSDWYTSRGYVSSGSLASNLKIFADSYSSTSYVPTATNVTIVASNGDITLTGLGGSGVTGVLFAPKGKVTFSGAYFTGVVIARDGFYVTSGGTTVIFQNLADYYSSSNDYPF